MSVKRITAKEIGEAWNIGKEISAIIFTNLTTADAIVCGDEPTTKIVAEKLKQRNPQRTVQQIRFEDLEEIPAKPRDSLGRALAVAEGKEYGLKDATILFISELPKGYKHPSESTSSSRPSGWSFD